MRSPIAPRLPQRSWRKRSSAAATQSASRWRAPASTQGAAASWTSSPPRTQSPCVWSSGATTSTPWPTSTCRPSGAATPCAPAASCPRWRPCRRSRRAARGPWPRRLSALPIPMSSAVRASRRLNWPPPCAPTPRSWQTASPSRTRTAICPSSMTRQAALTTFPKAPCCFSTSPEGAWSVAAPLKSS